MSRPEEQGVAHWYGPAKAMSNREARELSRLVESYLIAEGPAKSAIGHDIVWRLKKLPGWRSPLRWFSRTNVPGSWVIVSYHHRAQLCWEWAVWFSVGGAVRKRSWNPLHWFSHGYGQTSFGIPWVAQISLHRQTYGWMPSGDGANLIRFAAAERERQP